MRTFEIPACHAFMLAERTHEHLELFREGIEMACFSSPEELVDQVRYYLTHESERLQIAHAGHQRVLKENFSYKDRLEQIFKYVDSVFSARHTSI
jgi:spore maturation protein CgeB